MSAKQVKVFAEIANEREYQDTIWGAVADATHSDEEWSRFIEDYSKGLGRAEKYKGDFRTRMIKVAAIAVAAVEAHDRKAGT